MGVEVKIVLEGGAVVPKYQKDGDAGLDLCAKEEVLVRANGIEIVKTGVYIEIPHGYYGSVRDRSGLAAKHGLHVLAGVVDSGYRGEVRVVLKNLGSSDYKIASGERVAQMIIQPCAHADISLVDRLSDSDRGEGGFGSTGRV